MVLGASARAHEPEGPSVEGPRISRVAHGGGITMVASDLATYKAANDALGPSAGVRRRHALRSSKGSMMALQPVATRRRASRVSVRVRVRGDERGVDVTRGGKRSAEPTLRERVATVEVITPASSGLPMMRTGRDSEGQGGVRLRSGAVSVPAAGQAKSSSGSRSRKVVAPVVSSKVGAGRGRLGLPADVKRGGGGVSGRAVVNRTPARGGGRANVMPRVVRDGIRMQHGKAPTRRKEGSIAQRAKKPSKPVLLSIAPVVCDGEAGDVGVHAGGAGAGAVPGSPGLGPRIRQRPIDVDEHLAVLTSSSTLEELQSCGAVGAGEACGGGKIDLDNLFSSLQTPGAMQPPSPTEGRVFYLGDEGEFFRDEEAVFVPPYRAVSPSCEKGLDDLTPIKMEPHVDSGLCLVETDSPEGCARADGSAAFARPMQFIRFMRDTEQPASAEYDMDSEDERFVELVQSARGALRERSRPVARKSRRRRLTKTPGRHSVSPVGARNDERTEMGPEKFERMIDVVEKLASDARRELEAEAAELLLRAGTQQSDSVMSSPSVSAATSPRRRQFRPQLHSFTPSPVARRPAAAAGGSGRSGRSGAVDPLSGLQENRVDEDDTFCCVCFHGTSFVDNEIVFCDGCNIAVHQYCYGVPEIPEGPWLCDWCESLTPAQRRRAASLVRQSKAGTFRPVEVRATRRSVADLPPPRSCVFCHHTDGAFKRTTNGRWGHVLCALWIPRVRFLHAELMDVIEGAAQVLNTRQPLCGLCRECGGACMVCQAPGCQAAFHVTCAADAGLFMRIVENPDDSLSFVFYCNVHGHLGSSLPPGPGPRRRFTGQHEHPFAGGTGIPVADDLPGNAATLSDVGLSTDFAADSPAYSSSPPLSRVQEVLPLESSLGDAQLELSPPSSGLSSPGVVKGLAVFTPPSDSQISDSQETTMTPACPGTGTTVVHPHIAPHSIPVAQMPVLAFAAPALALLTASSSNGEPNGLAVDPLPQRAGEVLRAVFDALPDAAATADFGWQSASVELEAEAGELVARLRHATIEATLDEAAQRAMGALPKLVTVTRFLGSLKARGIKSSGRLAAAVYSYWLQKRARNRGRPLVAKYSQLQMSESLRNRRGFHLDRRRRRVSVRQLEDTFEKMESLRYNLETVRTMLELLRKRERLKGQIILLAVDVMRESVGLPRLSVVLRGPLGEHAIDVDPGY